MVGYTWDVFTTLDGFGSYDERPGGVDWGGYWSKQGPELLQWRAELFSVPQRMVYGATTFREVAGIFEAGIDPLTLDDWNQRLLRMAATVISSTLEQTLGWPDATIERGDAVEIVRELKRSSEMPLRSQASLSLNWSLLEAGLVDEIQVTVFPVITGRTGISPIYAGLGDHDLELVESRTLDGRTLGLTYRPTARR
ncbi:dihydrofolate reductase family protein [Litorihabitans aurantiacus]|uniref:Deaminase reductase n=1 Tax=Litorihabitans aurantiacus TaxID=1930061 RepID=A0AA38CTJ8_9MICO|nr:dihydrofolate reductase family protein [Litorihabitans aurantiacus]GMA32184.1 deaminase reductase [Litorihabitans aurantiacus]